MSWSACRCLFLLLFLCGLPFWLASPAVAGLEFLQTSRYVLDPDAVQERELWLAADEITVHGTMEKALFGVGGSAELSGRFERDASLAARDILFHGHVAESARLAARHTVDMRGRVDSSLMAAAGRALKFEETASVQRDALFMAPTVLLHGRVHGRAAVWARRAILTGHIDGDLYVRAEDISILPGTRIGGNITYSAPHELVLDPSVYVGGQIERREISAPGLGAGQRLIVQFILFVGALITGLLFIAIFPRYTGQTVRRIRHTFWQTTLIGSLALFLLPVLAGLALLTIVGIPAGLLLAGTYLVMLYLAKIVVALAFGGMLLQRRGPQPYGRVAGTLALGLVLLYFLAGLPIVGSVGTIIIMCIGLGGLILGLSDVQYGQQPPPLRGVHTPKAEKPGDALSNEHKRSQ